MTEHQLQRELAQVWAGTGIPTPERIMLLGREVMLPSWRINDAKAHWGQPAADFLGIDGAGHLVIVELKVNLRGVRPVLDATSQLTAAALLCERSDMEEGLLVTLSALARGENDRGIRVMQGTTDLAEVFGRHQRFFHLSEALERIAPGTRRVLVVRQPGRGVADLVTRLPTPVVVAELEQSYSGHASSRMQARLSRLLPVRDGELIGPISYLEV